jgi:hypothetical protein
MHRAGAGQGLVGAMIARDYLHSILKRSSRIGVSSSLTIAGVTNGLLCTQAVKAA